MNTNSPAGLTSEADSRGKAEKCETAILFAYQAINEWLKFAEQKNAGLIALNAGLFWSAINSSIFTSPSGTQYLLNFVGIASIIISSLICLTSFMPILTQNWLKPGTKNGDDNCLFFAHIAKYNTREYLALLATRLELKSCNINSYYDDLACQVVTNAEIALVKFLKFRIASIFLIVAIAALSVSYLSFRIYST